ncbi:hypothetical protein GCM10007079_37900 [Nocardiopsis terrae]|uniref:Uncharacterized protein n=1 Tax=Nocardiopsis terrae TaxID=372655 RepID=A0ABR9HDR0_9ACTN|nr:hypothetical protein [Nocardiopsis terrae]MBE1457178.1 hypothetical protein [Nocardiopsis terrae]GHC91020.1 hypothetical protein GCM10007079_37900 [Nocardiopsis terrae]
MRVSFYLVLLFLSLLLLALGLMEENWAYWNGTYFDEYVRLAEYELAHVLVSFSLVLQLLAFRLMWRHRAPLIICASFSVVCFGFLLGVT